MPDRIIVIEDDEVTCHAYEQAISAAGYQTVGFETYFAAAKEIDAGAGALLVVDLRLPVGTPQGLSIARMARNHRPGLPVIFVADEPEPVELVGEENSSVMLKPIDLNLLVAKVHDLLAVAVETPPKAGS